MGAVDCISTSGEVSLVLLSLPPQGARVKAITKAKVRDNTFFHLVFFYKIFCIFIVSQQGQACSSMAA
jgi:hypothetical protein